jgi:nucleoid DNA-binding protein
MTHDEFIQQFAAETGMSVQDAQNVMASFEKCLIQGMQTGGIVELNMGAFKISDRTEKRGINPATGDEIVIPAKRVVHFRSSKSFNKML